MIADAKPPGAEAVDRKFPVLNVDRGGRQGEDKHQKADRPQPGVADHSSASSFRVACSTARLKKDAPLRQAPAVESRFHSPRARSGPCTLEYFKDKHSSPAEEQLDGARVITPRRVETRLHLP